MSLLALLGIVGALATPAGEREPSAIEIATDSSCPSPDLIRAALGAFGTMTPSPGTTATVRARNDRIRVELRWPGHATMDVREVAAPAGCEARAQAAAVVMAAWLGTRASAPVAPGPAAPTVLAKTEPRTPPSPSARPPQPAPAREGRRHWLGVGLGAAAGGGTVPAGRVELAAERLSGEGIGWSVAVQSALPRNRMVGVGTSTWMRPSLNVAAQAGGRLGRIVLAADLGPTVGLALAWGSGYPSNLSDQTVAFGGAAGLRVELADGPSRPWLQIRVMDWLQAQRLRVDASPSAPVTENLPKVEGILAIGWSLLL